MTAEIAILNKSVVALAADSAVTINTGTETGNKIFNTANKIFNLSKHQPVGVMIYSSATFMGIPWEVLIKMYREQLGEKPFETVIQYQNDFLKFINDNLQYINTELITINLRRVLFEIFNKIDGQIEIAIKGKFSEEDLNSMSQEDKIDFWNESLKQILPNHLTNSGKQPYLSNYKKFDFSNFTELNSQIDEYLRWTSEENKKEFGKIINGIFQNCIQRNIFLEESSGVVFAGFGTKEIFPSITSITLGTVIGKEIRFFENGETKIDHKQNSRIHPFAQRDMIDTFVQGIEPELYKIFQNVLRESLNSFESEVINVLDKKDREADLKLVTQKVFDNLISRFDEIKVSKHIRPIISMVASLNKEEMAELAESLINLTYLKRHVTSDEETVGGPIDVAVITKGDGFIWIKRKHYFKPELNLNFVGKQISKHS